MVERTYKGFKIVGKTDPCTFFNDSRISIVPHELPCVAEIYYPDGCFMQWVSSSYGFGVWNAVRNAASAINEYLDPHEPEYTPW